MNSRMSGMNVTMFGRKDQGMGMRGGGRPQQSPDWRNSELLNPQNGAFGQEDYGGGYSGGYQHNVGQEIMYLKQDNEMIKQAIATLERDRDNLRQAIRKLKVENSRLKQKSDRLTTVIKKGGGAAGEEMETDLAALDEDDFGDKKIGEFILVGGPKDPFSLRYEVPIKDEGGVEHQSSERYLWYKMAETFDDKDAMEKIRVAATGAKAEEEMQKIKNFDENVWNPVKVKHWEDGQRFKFEQVSWIRNLLVFTKALYIAVASQDKVWGTGWRKQRQEAERPRMWDGENQGGKILMKLRDGYKDTHTWTGPYDEQETEKKFNTLKKEVWKRQRPARDGGRPQGRIGGGRGGMGGGLGFKRPRRF